MRCEHKHTPLPFESTQSVRPMRPHDCMNTNTIHKETVYRGIDYGRGMSNVDTKTGIRFGVISQHSVMPEALDSVWQEARDLSCEQAIADAKRELAACETDEDIADFLRENFSPRQIERIGAIDLMDDADTRWAAVEDCWNDNYCSDGNHDWLYEADGYKLVNCLQSDIMVLASPYFTYAQYCSPCVPGACNLDSPLETAHEDNRAYCLGHDWFDGGQAPYPVYSVATGERVNP